VNPNSAEVVELLRRHGLRPTRARRLVLARLARSNDHLSVDELRAELRRHGQPVSVATLYQNLKRLVAEGLLASFAGADGLVRFDANTDSHAHLVCAGCGRIADVGPEDPVLKRLKVAVPRPARRMRGWTLAEARLELRGLCPACGRPGRRRARFARGGSTPA
jgi:Fe2+ or Zn2+ uptake regulation protein